MVAETCRHRRTRRGALEGKAVVMMEGIFCLREEVVGVEPAHVGGECMASVDVVASEGRAVRLLRGHVDVEAAPLHEAGEGRRGSAG